MIVLDLNNPMWDANRDFAALGEIENQPQLDWVRAQRIPIAATR
jgi:hypothetical protein